jgi:NodT family efflux transporter outer membrane factor (OMF) lipoprotein
MKRLFQIAPLLLKVALPAMILIGGCMVGPDFKPPPKNPPSGWIGVNYNSTNAASVTTTNAPDLVRWWEKFGDPKLTALVDEALRTNLDVQLAEARLRQARAQRGVAAGGIYPAVTGAAAYTRFYGGGTTPRDSFQAGLDAVWELDIFGGIRRGIESANANIQAARENLHDVQVTLVSEVAVNYIQLRSFQEQIDIANDNLKSEQHTADLTQRKLAAGFASALDLANANSAVATTASEVPVLQTSVQQNIYALSVLLARPPGALLDDLSKSAPVPLTPPNIPVGLPSELLRRRPDVREAEAQFHAATAQIGVATADLFPQFSLTGSVNAQSDLLRTLFAGPNRIWAVGPSMTWPIFQGGAIVSNIRVQKALRDQAGITYQKTVLSAFQDVENALIAFAKEWEHRKALSDAVTFNTRAVDLSTRLYQQGTTDFLSVLVAERSLFSSQTALAQSKANISTDLVALYKALGGGWTDPVE